MQSKRITTEPPSITEEVFEECLATDDMLVEYFNEFLSLPVSTLQKSLAKYKNLQTKVTDKTFAQPVKFNSDFGVFEVVNDAPQHLESQLKKILHDQKSPNLIYDVLRKAKDNGQTSKPCSASPALAIDPNDTTMQYLDREQAMQWIKEERLPAFLESDCYFEYRLAKLISQVEWSKTGINFIIDNDYYPWKRKQDPGSPHLEEDDSLLTLKKFGQSESRNTTDTFLRPVAPGQREKESLLEAGSLSEGCHQQSFLSPSRPASPKADIIKERSREDVEDFFVAITESPSHNQLRVYLDPKWDNVPKEENGQETTTLTAKTFLPAPVQSVREETLSELTQQTAADIEGDVDFHKHPEAFKHELASNEFAHGTEEETEEVSLRSGSESDGADSRAAWCVSHRTYDTGSRHQFERFKKFIKGTLGERYWWLWMDIERLKSLRDTARQQRHLSKMKTLYLLSSGDYCLSSEVLLRLNLLHGDQWNINHLSWIQPEVVKPLLLYWGPRFCVTHSTAIETASAKLKLWHTYQERPRVDIDPFPQIVSLVPWTPKSCMPGIPPSLPQISSGLSPTLPSDQSSPRDISSSRMWAESMSRDTIRCLGLEDTEVSGYQGQRKYTYAELLSGNSAAGSVVLRGSRMESMLQSLYLENRAGYHFTQFCEKSGNKLWKNSVYFWFDLQAYQQLFYQETLHPFKICKQAQFLYATYIAPSASMDIGLHQSKKNMIYQKIDPAFEDLFDPAEKYVLTILLEPWMKMMEADKDTYGKVELVEEAQQLDSVYFRKLQALHHKSSSKKDESAVADTGVLPCLGALKEDQHSGQVPKEVAGPKLSDLIHDKEKLEQFRAFLSKRSAGMDLMCWLDIEQFRKMLHQDKEKREEKAEEIQSKYFSEKYLFGPNSPASREQQEQLMRSGGGRGQIPHDQLSAAVLLEVQQCVQKRLEKQWLPLFLAEQHRRARGRAKRMKRSFEESILEEMKPDDILHWASYFTVTKLCGHAMYSLLRKSALDLRCICAAKKLQDRHVDTQWLASPSDIIAFRQALLNPVTAKEFQCFLSLRGDLLENGVLFWQEVQKYKDLCHSHCDDAIVQRKITAIINRFINSAIPPALQIDIPAAQAKKILEHRKELGPYIFREAQMTVFALLFKFWPKFCKFRSNADSDKILLALERERSKRMRKKEWKTAEEKLAKFQTKLKSAEALLKATHQGRANSKLQELPLLSPKHADSVQISDEDRGRKERTWPGGQKPSFYGEQMGKMNYHSKRGSRSKELERRLSSLAGSVLANETGMERGLAAFSDGYGWQASWSFSKYIEALEQERILLKLQEELEKSSSSLLTGAPSVSFPKPGNSEKSSTSSRTSVTSKKQAIPLRKQSSGKSP